MDTAPLMLDGSSLTVAAVHEVSRALRPVAVSASTRQRIAACRAMMDDLIESGVMIYGITTGMGGMREWLVPPSRANEMQMNLLRGVAANVGPLFDDDIVRASMLARLNSLARANSAIQLENFDTLLQMLNAGIHPLVPAKGSLGASGDLAPLGAIALAATGEGTVRHRGRQLPALEALTETGIAPMRLEAKEGLALVNGTSCMAGLGALVLHDCEMVSDAADVIAAFSVEALGGRLGPFDPRVHRLKPHPGQQRAAENIARLTEGSQLALSEADLQRQVASQHSGTATRKASTLIMDAYSIRCIPHVHGPMKECLAFSKAILEHELNSSNDDPLIVADEGTCFHNGHFHGQYVAMVMDLVATAVTAVALMSDRRIDRYMDQHHNGGLPPFLCDKDAGIRIGLQAVQFTTSSIAAENRAKCTPLSVQSIPSAEDFQDFVSMGLVGARRSYEVVRDTAYVLAFEAVCAAQACDLRGADKLSLAGRQAHALTRSYAPFVGEDRSMTACLERLAQSILDGEYAALLRQANPQPV